MSDFLRRLQMLTLPVFAPAEDGAGGGGADEGGSNSGQADRTGDRNRDKGGGDKVLSVREALKQSLAEARRGKDGKDAAGDDDGGDDDAGDDDTAGGDAGDDDGEALPGRGRGGRFTKRDAAGAEDGDGEQNAEGADKPAEGEEGDGDNADADQEGDDNPASDQDQPAIAKPPASWKPEARADWEKLPPATRAYIHERETQMAKGLDQFKASVAPKITVADQVYGIVQPYSQVFAARGIKPLDAIRETMREAYLINHGTAQEKMQIFRGLATKMGFTVEGDMALGGDGDAGGALPPAVQQELDQLRELVQTVKGGQDAAIVASVKEQADRFEHAKDSQGKPLHPHYSKVRATMGDLIRGGLAQDLNEAYAKACKLVPEVDQAIAAEREAKRKADQKKKEGERLARARQANGGVSGRPGGSKGGAPDKTGGADGSNLRATIAAAVRGGQRPARV